MRKLFLVLLVVGLLASGVPSIQRAE